MRKVPLVVVLLGLTLAACGGGSGGSGNLKQPAVSAFADGTCRVAAPDVLTLGKTGAKLGSGNTISADAKTSLKQAQDGLRTVADGAEPAYKPALEALVVSTGFVRIRADGNTYQPSLGKQLMKDYNAVLKACGAAK